jgi:hypothetical protein
MAKEVNVDNLFDFIKVFFNDPIGYSTLSTKQKSQHAFMLNRFFSIKYPQQAAMFNKTGMNASAIVDAWHLVALQYKRTPGWIYTKTTKSKVKNAEIIPDEAVEKAGYDSLDAAKEEGTAFVFMGHGTSHTAKISYSQMQSQMTALGYENVFIGTVEGEPEDTSCESVIEKVSAAGYKNVILRPLMVVAGDHANNDMAGSDDDSWLSQFKASGKFDKIDTQINGLGEIEGIQKLYVEHTAAAMSK